MKKGKRTGKLFKRLRAMTLIELVVALGILGILSTTSFIFVPEQLKKARDGKRKSDLHIMSRTLESYYDIDDAYPGELPDCGSPLKAGETEWMEIPCDPKLKDDYFYETGDEEEAGLWFRIYTNLERDKDPSITWAKCQSGCGPDCQYNYGVTSTNINLEICLPPVVQYVCAPGGGSEGSCQAYEDPELSQCPKVFVDDPTCNNECGDNEVRCKNASGKYKPDEK